MADQNRTPPYPLTPDAVPPHSPADASLSHAPDDPRARLLKQIEEAPHAFDFYQAVRRLDCAHPDKPQTGHSSRLADDPIRFGQEASMAFAPATLQGLETSSGKPPRLIQRFFGLCGPQGPLPLHLTEYVRDRARNHDDFTLLRFFDVFHHRMLAFFYRAWARVRPTVSFDQPAYDRISDYVGSLFGLGMRSLQRRDALPDLPKLHFAGLLSCQTKHAEGLLAMLSGYFRLPVQIEEFVGQWIELPTDCRCMMGLSSSTLGVNTTVGSHVWDCQQKFRVILGPLSLDEYYRMLPGESEKTFPEEELTAEREEGSFAELVASSQYEQPHRWVGGQGTSAKSGTTAAAPPPGFDPLAEDASQTKDESFSLADHPFQHGIPLEMASNQSHGRGESVGEHLDQLESASDSSAATTHHQFPSPLEAPTDTPPHDPEGGAVASSRYGPRATDYGWRASHGTSSRFKTPPLPAGEGEGESQPPTGNAPSPYPLPREEGFESGSSGIGGSTTRGVTPLGLGKAERAVAGTRRAGSSPSSRHAGLDRLIAAVRTYIGDELQWDLQLILRKEDTPPLGLGIVGHLGWSTWLLRDPMPRDPDDMVLDATHTPTTKEKLPYRHVRRWGHLTLGQTRDGRYIVATVAPQVLDPLPAESVK